MEFSVLNFIEDHQETFRYIAWKVNEPFHTNATLVLFDCEFSLNQELIEFFNMKSNEQVNVRTLDETTNLINPSMMDIFNFIHQTALKQENDYFFFDIHIVNDTIIVDLEHF